MTTTEPAGAHPDIPGNPGPDTTGNPGQGIAASPSRRRQAYFRRLDDGQYAPEPLAAGIWGAKQISGRILGGLIGQILELEQAAAGYSLTRLTVDLFRAIPFAPLTVTTSLVRAGGRIRVADLAVSHDGTLISRATASYLRPSSNPPGEIWHAEREDPPAPDPATPGPDLAENLRADVRPMLAGSPGNGVGPTAGIQRGGLWMRELADVVEGIPLTPRVRAVLVADVTSPTTHRGTAGLHHINTDVTLTLVREPVGEFFGVLARDQYGVDGISFGLATVYDTAGLLGSITTTALANTGRADSKNLPAGILPWPRDAQPG